MNAEVPKKRSGALFWLILGTLFVAPLGTIAIVAYTRIKSPYHTPVLNYAQEGKPQVIAPGAPNASAKVDPRVEAEGNRICGAFQALLPTLAGDGMAAPEQIWKQLGVPGAPVDPWGQPYEWQPWNRAVRSRGPDGKRGTPDDLVHRCEG